MEQNNKARNNLTYGQLIFNKSVEEIQQENNSFLTNGTKKIGYSNVSPHKIDPCLTFTKTSSKWIKT